MILPIVLGVGGAIVGLGAGAIAAFEYIKRNYPKKTIAEQVGSAAAAGAADAIAAQFGFTRPFTDAQIEVIKAEICKRWPQSCAPTPAPQFSINSGMPQFSIAPTLINEPMIVAEPSIAIGEPEPGEPVPQSADSDDHEFHHCTCPVGASCAC